MKSKLLFISGIISSLLIGWIVFPALLYKHINQPLQFSHKVHTGESGGMACEDCHTLSAEGRFQGIPRIAKCGECHAAQLGTSENESLLVETYINSNKEIPWLVYSRQPDNAAFNHSTHLNLGNLKCEECHGPHGNSDSLKVYQVNLISGYSRDIWGENISGIPSQPWQGMKMDKCVRCHADNGRRDGCVACHK